MEVFDTAKGVSDTETEIRVLQSKAAPMIHAKPVEPFASEG